MWQLCLGLSYGTMSCNKISVIYLTRTLGKSSQQWPWGWHASLYMVKIVCMNIYVYIYIYLPVFADQILTMKIKYMKVGKIYSLCVFNEQSSFASFMACMTNIVTGGDSTWWGMLSSFYWACDYLSMLGLKWATMLPSITSRAVQILGIIMPCHGFVCRSEHPSGSEIFMKVTVKQTVPRCDKNTIKCVPLA